MPCGSSLRPASAVGNSTGLDEAPRRGCTVVDMKGLKRVSIRRQAERIGGVPSHDKGCSGLSCPSYSLNSRRVFVVDIHLQSTQRTPPTHDMVRFVRDVAMGSRILSGRTPRSESPGWFLDGSFRVTINSSRVWVRAPAIHFGLSP